MSGFFEDGLARASEFREILHESDIIADATVIEGSSYTTEYDIQVLGFRFAIIEVKNEIASRGPEPHAQGISYYIHSTKSSVAERPGFRFPCIIITLFGKPHNGIASSPVFLQPDQVLISISRLLFGVLVQTYRYFRLPCPSFTIAQTPECAQWSPVISVH